MRSKEILQLVKDAVVTASYKKRNTAKIVKSYCTIALKTDRLINKWTLDLKKWWSSTEYGSLKHSGRTFSAWGPGYQIDTCQFNHVKKILHFTICCKIIIFYLMNQADSKNAKRKGEHEWKWMIKHEKQQIEWRRELCPSVSPPPPDWGGFVLGFEPEACSSAVYPFLRWGTGGSSRTSWVILGKQQGVWLFNRLVKISQQRISWFIVSRHMIL